MSEEMNDYREDGMDYSTDSSSSRSSSETSSNMATPSSPRMHLVTLEDCEDDEDYQDYMRKVLGEWGGRYGCHGDQGAAGQEGGRCEPVNSRSLAEEFRDVPCPPPARDGRSATLAAAVPEELKQNGNVIVVTSPQPVTHTSMGWQRGAGAGAGGRTVGVVVPPIDWDALEKHLAELPPRGWEGHRRNQNQRRTSSTSVSVTSGLSACLSQTEGGLLV
ncbi:hypothetical protein AGOR_G00243720 [Albula goreensis]|uniref:Uncharacterized protein n=1 Tax=Albula goreensis TaxID=1534307 RepID=A0A8T3CJN4_9TELE|nr:hypothetical protein AGOR_G00243720 [Albula goreensis]